jgi:hypothetical protein
MVSTPWTSFGNRLFRRGNAFFIRVRIPRDLQDLYAATGRRSEICETLKTAERREAERRCRRRGAEIDQEFAQRRRERAAASQAISSNVAGTSPELLDTPALLNRITSRSRANPSVTVGSQ